MLKKSQAEEGENEEGDLASSKQHVALPGFFLMSQRSLRGSMSGRHSHDLDATSDSGGDERGSSSRLGSLSVPGSARRDVVLKQGLLQKRARHMRVWQPRWVVLEAEFLSYFEDSSAGRANRKRPKGVILLQECSARPGTEPLAFDLLTPSRSYQLRAADEDDLQVGSCCRAHAYARPDERPPTPGSLGCG